MSTCIFCQIATGEIPARFVYQDDQVIAFWDLHPVAPVHVLVVPRHHADDLLALSGDPAGPDVMAALLRAIPLIARQLGVAQTGFRLINNCGPDAGQTISHVHFHLIGGRRLGAKII
jgi:histidine triad (HIT) family protein